MTIESGNFDSGFDFEPPNDDDEEGGSRLFIILAVGQAGLIVLGLVAIGGVLMLRKIQNKQLTAQVTPVATPTLMVAAQLPTATSAPPTATPTEVSKESLPPTATSTSVVVATSSSGASSGGSQNGGEGAATGTPTPTAAGATSTATAVVPVGTPVSSAEVPNTGFGGLELALIAIGLIAVLFVARRLRRQSI